MEANETTSSTEKLKMRMIGTAIAVMFGCVATAAVSVFLPLLFVMPVRSVTTAGSAPPPPQTFPFAALIPLAGIALAFVLVAYGIYRVIKLYSEYRKSKAMDEVLFQ